MNMNLAKERMKYITAVVIYGTIGFFLRYVSLPSEIVAMCRGIVWRWLCFQKHDSGIHCWWTGTLQLGQTASFINGRDRHGKLSDRTVGRLIKRLYDMPAIAGINIDVLILSLVKRNNKLILERQRGIIYGN